MEGLDRMKATNLYAPTLREVPAEAEVISHKLMLRAGMIRKAAGGLYTYLPLAWRVLKKIENIVREEMDAKGGQELLMNKYRDERRPRFGLMRGREFIMKDLYSFDKDEAGLDISYQKMYEAYENIFRRCGLKCRPVEADGGAIGGKGTHEFMVFADSGEAAEPVRCDSGVAGAGAGGAISPCASDQDAFGKTSGQQSVGRQPTKGGPGQMVGGQLRRNDF